MFTRHCGTCGFFDPPSGTCAINVPLLGLENPADGYCHNHTPKVKICDCCGNGVVPWGKMRYLGNDAIICPICDEKFGLCETCRGTHQECAFNVAAQNSNIPPIVQKVVVKGNMKFTTQVRNPELMKQVCPGCGCYDGENCGMDTGYGCANYRLHSIRE